MKYKKEVIKDIEKIIHDRHGYITIKELTHLSGYSRNTLLQYFHDVMGISINDYKKQVLYNKIYKGLSENKSKVTIAREMNIRPTTLYAIIVNTPELLELDRKFYKARKKDLDSVLMDIKHAIDSDPLNFKTSEINVTHGVSRKHFYDLFKRKFNIAVQDYLMKKRVEFVLKNKNKPDFKTYLKGSAYYSVKDLLNRLSPLKHYNLTEDDFNVN